MAGLLRHRQTKGAATDRLGLRDAESYFLLYPSSSSFSSLAWFLGNALDRHGPAAPSHEEGEAFGVERIVRKPVQGFLLHLAACLALDATNLHLQVDPSVPAGQVAHAACLAVVPGPSDLPARAACRIFPAGIGG